jgi:hypothetical protein
MHHIFLKNFPKLFLKMGGAPSIFFYASVHTMYKNKSIKNFNKKVYIIKNCLLQKKLNKINLIFIFSQRNIYYI